MLSSCFPKVTIGFNPILTRSNRRHNPSRNRSHSRRSGSGSRSNRSGRHQRRRHNRQQQLLLRPRIIFSPR